ncbi:MAG: hypothetical protein ABIT38_22385 [Gemmatimonadaceae bacterium]
MRQLRHLTSALRVGGALATPARAQVFQLQGGGSSLFTGYGGVVNVWGNGYDGSLGIGYLDGLRVGASANALAAPYFAANRVNHAIGYAHASYDISRSLSFGAHAVLTSRQSLIASASWRPAFNIATTAAGGIESNAPYAATGLETRSTHFEVRAAYAFVGDHFRRADAPLPLQSESERENLLFTWRQRTGHTLTAGRQHFRQDSSFAGIPQRATLTQLGINATPLGTSLPSGVFLSEAEAQRNVSSFLSARSPMLGRL